MEESVLIRTLDNTVENTSSNIALIDYRNFYFPPEPDKNCDIQVVHINYNKCQPGYSIQRNSYPYYVMEYIISGEAYFEVDNRKYSLKPGMIFGFLPETPHSYGCDDQSQDFLEKICISFKLNNSTDEYKLGNLLNRAFHINNPLKVQTLFEEILYQGENNSYYSRKIVNRLTEVLLMSLIESDFNSQPYPNSFHTFSKCKTVISEQSSIDVSMTDISEQCGINVSYMIRLFKRYMGCTPKQYIDKLIVEGATKLLLESDSSIKEISYKLGFTNQYYFSSFYKKHMHVCPSELRRID